MNPPSLVDSLSERLKGEYDLVDVIAIPATLDHAVRLRTLEDALREFDGDEEAEELQQYLVQVKPRRTKPASFGFQSPPAEPQAPEPEQVYLPDGSLNVAFLTRNAELLVGCGDYALARNIYHRIAQAGISAMETSRALFGLANCFEKEGNLEEARARYEQSIAFHPAIESYRHLASLLISQRKDRPAAEALERALALKELKPTERIELLKAAGSCWSRSNEPASAERAYKKALEIDPSADQIQAELGTLYLQAGKINEARRKFQDTLASNPRNDKAIVGLAMCQLQDGDKRSAHDQFARALDINLNNPQAVYHLVKCAYELRTYATAARIVEAYIDVAPVNINLLYSLGGLQFHLGRIGDARSTVNRIIQMNSSHSGAKELLRRIDGLSDGLSCHGGQEHNGN